MDLDAFLGLLTPRGQKALAEAAELVGADPVAAATRLRRTYDASITSAALTQAALRERAKVKFGDDAARMYFTPHGLEQATHGEVAAHRVRRLASLLPGLDGLRVADVCCGIGGDLITLARAGCVVDAADLDPLTVAVARANADALGVGERVRIRVADAADVDPSAFDLLFADPARRTSRGRTFDPLAYSPSWPVVVDLLRRAPAACVKVAPGLPYDLIPGGATAEWVSHRGEVKEATIWTGALGYGGAGRLATLLPGGHTLSPTGAVAAVGPLGAYLYEPDGAAIRAHLVAEVADLVGGRLADPLIAYISGDEPVDTPWAVRYEVHGAFPFNLKRLRKELRDREIGNVTIKKRGSALDVEKLRRDLRLSGEKSATIVLTRVMDQPFALLCSPSRPA
ncbi:THUMP-like domain-containing protein [Thermoactinospora rubra]|uniref:class I SAM-dependent methyltransferase n=1 Tax=Thermoactinospora rubra TaxID=1088767 RepID=UPI000A10FD94|nr:methyltransferase domain-containing protein [Thermoactinospora rubra]